MPERAAAGGEEVDALVILANPSPTLAELYEARQAVVRRGARVTTVLPPHALIVRTFRENAPAIASDPLVASIHFDEVEAVCSGGTPASGFAERTRFVWNRMLANRAPRGLPDGRSLEQFPEPALSGPARAADGEFGAAVRLAPAVSRDELDREYTKHWVRHGAEISRQALEAQGMTYVPTDRRRSVPLDPPLSTFGRATGAGAVDTSLYLAGDVALKVFFLAGPECGDPPCGDWDTMDMYEQFATIWYAVNKLAASEPSAQVTFIVVPDGEHAIPLQSEGEPEDVWRATNDLRNIWNTHWAYLVYAYNRDDFTPATSLFGPIMVLPYGVGSTTIQHETCHIFGAMDQYGNRNPEERGGYLNTINANSVEEGGSGYFDGLGEGLTDMMRGGEYRDRVLSTFTRGQLGWRGARGDGVLDPLDTYPHTILNTPSGAGSRTYTGIAADRPRPNDCSWFHPEYSHGSVTLNTISAVEYRIARQPQSTDWIEAQAADGAFDAGVEAFTFTLPDLPIGTYTISVQATNSRGNIESSPAEDTFVVDASAVDNLAPFARFSVTPEEGSTSSVFVLDASGSGDLEDPDTSLSVRWDFNGDGTWDSPWLTTMNESTQFPTPGYELVRLQVRDSGGAISEVAERQIYVSPRPLPPRAHLVVTPDSECGHLYSQDPTIQITAVVSGSSDAEDSLGDLTARLDIDGDGAWDVEAPANEGPFACDLEIPMQPPLHASIPISLTHDPEALFVSGDYAYVAEGDGGLRIIDLTTTSAQVYDTAGPARSVVVVGPYAYVACAAAGLEIVDVSDPADPEFAGGLVLDQGETEVISLDVLGDYAYLACYDEGLRIVNVANPHDPEAVPGGSVEPPEPECGDAWDVAVVEMLPYGRFAHVAWGTSGLCKVDVSDPSQPWIEDITETDATARAVTLHGTLAYVFCYYRVLIIDAEESSVEGRFGTNTFCCGCSEKKGVAVSGDRAYLAYGKAGFQIIDVSQPTQPRYVGGPRPPADARDVAVVGNYAYVLNAAADPPALEIFDLTDNLEVAPGSINHAVTLEIEDTDGNLDQDVQNVWAVTYNRQPTLTDFSLTGFEDAHALSYLTGVHLYTAEDVAVHAERTLVAGGAEGLHVVEFAGQSHAVTGLETYITAGPAQGVAISDDGALAFVAAGEAGLEIVDLATLEAMANVVWSEADFAYDVALVGDLAIVADGESGIHVVDVQSPSAPVHRGSCDTAGTARGLAVSGDTAYVADDDNGLVIVDVSSPTKPSLLGQRHTLGQARQVVLAGASHVLVANGEGGLRSMDVSDPANPALNGHSPTSGWANDVVVQAGHACVASDNGLDIVNIADPARPRFVAAYDLPDSPFQHNAIACRDDHLYVATTTEGLRVYRSQPGWLVSFDTVASDPDPSGTWGGGDLEYRFDLDSDGLWETPFVQSTSGLLVDEYPDVVTCQVRDFFAARDQCTKAITPTYGPMIDCDGDQVDDREEIAADPDLDCNYNWILDSCIELEEDCNDNGLPDFCDIAEGTAEDCNHNGVPDTCDLEAGTEQDCNDNDIPDSCDIASQTSSDIDGNGVPDECQGPILLSAGSRKWHGLEAFDVPRNSTECRAGTIDLIVMTFDEDIFSTPGGDPFLPAAFDTSTGQVTFVSAFHLSLTLHLAGVADDEHFDLSFVGYNHDGIGETYDLCWGVTIGDVNGDMTVDRDDEALLISADGHTVHAYPTEFRCDLDLDGTVEGNEQSHGDDWVIWHENEGDQTTGCSHEPS